MHKWASDLLSQVLLLLSMTDVQMTKRRRAKSQMAEAL
jgi:hypothetical protein